MLCDRCTNTIHGAPDVVSIETGSGVAAEVLLCMGGCRPAARQRYPVEPIVLSTQDSRARPRRRQRR